MNAVRRLIETYQETRGALPPTFDALLPREPRERWVVDYEHDAWRRRFRYSTTGTKYELRSAGPDGTFGTADDIVATEEVPAPNP